MATSYLKEYLLSQLCKLGIDWPPPKEEEKPVVVQQTITEAGYTPLLPTDEIPVALLPGMLRLDKQSWLNALSIEATFSSDVEDGDLVYPVAAGVSGEFISNIAELRDAVWKPVNQVSGTASTDEDSPRIWGIAYKHVGRVMFGPVVFHQRFAFKTGDILYVGNSGKITNNNEGAVLGICLAPGSIFIDLSVTSSKLALDALQERVDKLEQDQEGTGGSISDLTEEIKDIQDELNNKLENGDNISNSTVTATGSTTARPLKDRFADMANVKDYGAKGDGTSDDIDAFLAASNKGSVFVPYGSYLLNVDTDIKLSGIIEALKGMVLFGKVTVKVTGHRESSKPIVIDCLGGSNLTITGACTDVSITSVGTPTGSAGNYSVPVTLASSNGVSVGDILVIRGDNCTVGTGCHEVLRGAWRISSISGNTVNVVNTCWKSAFPEFNVTSGFGFVAHSVVTFKNCDGIIVKSATLGELSNIAIAGNATEYWQSSNISGTEKGTNGIYVGGPTIYLNGKTDDENPLGVTNASASLNRYVAVIDFDQQGIVCTKGASIYARFCVSSSNRRRGWYAELSGSIWCKNAVGSGNYLDGFIADMGVIGCNLSTAAGNGGAGFNCITCGIMQGSTCVAVANVGDGFYVNGSGCLYSGASIAKYNTIGFHTAYCGALLGSNLAAEKNSNDGFRAETNSVIRMIGGSATSNGRYGVYASSMGCIWAVDSFTASGNTNNDIYAASMGMVAGDGIDSTNIAIPYNVTISGKLNASNDQLIKIVRDNVDTVTLGVTSIADVVMNSTASGELLRIKAAQESLLPGVDNTTTLGRESTRWSTIYAGTGTINTSDRRLKVNISDLSDKLLDSWESVSPKLFQFTDSVEKKGANARAHVGLIAQDIKDALSLSSLEASTYGFFCYDKWEDEWDGEKQIVKAGDRYSIRYDEALCLEAAYQRRRASRLEARVAALETALQNLNLPITPAEETPNE